MKQEIQKLIDLALSDGVLSSKEREIILRKAKSLGEDVDEVEMFLENQISNFSSKNKDSVDQKSSLKEGEIRKCPSCGAVVKSFQIKCLDCGHEFRESKVLSSKQKLHNELNVAEREIRSSKLSGLDKLGGPQVYDLKVNARKASIISSFPLPNNKEDILEFFNWAIHESMNTGAAHDDGTLRKAWRAKAKELRSKINLELSNDSHAQLLIKEFDRSAKKIIIPRQIKILIGFIIFFILMGVFFNVMSRSADDSIQKEKERLEAIVSKIYEDVNEENYDAALIKASTLKWENIESYYKSEIEMIPIWDDKRNEIIKAIEKSKKSK
jgi:uncharacterized tellurite resistance protein B-like protein